MTSRSSRPKLVPTGNAVWLLPFCRTAPLTWHLHSFQSSSASTDEAHCLRCRCYAGRRWRSSEPGSHLDVAGSFLSWRTGPTLEGCVWPLRGKGEAGPTFVPQQSMAVCRVRSAWWWAVSPASAPWVHSPCTHCDSQVSLDTLQCSWVRRRGHDHLG